MAQRTEVADEAVIAAPFGRVRIVMRGGALVDVDLLSGGARLRSPRTPAARGAVAALRRYLRDARAPLALPVAMAGSRFQRRVWRALQRIPAGEVRSYGQLARRLRTSARAVGGACRANPLPLVIPCHRVVAASGWGGFMGRRQGAALAIKRWLLEHERAR